MVQPISDQEILIKAQVLEIVQKIGLAQTPHALLEALSDLAVIKDATRLAIMLFESKSGQSQAMVETVAVYDTRPNSIDRVGFTYSREDMPLPWDLDISQPFVAENIHLDNRINHYTRDVLTQIGVQSLAGFALVVAATHLGWLLIEYETPRQYTSFEVAFLEILTKQIATVLYNQLLVKELSLRTQELETEKAYLNRLYQVTARLDAANDIETLLAILVDFAATIQAMRYMFYIVEDTGEEHLRCSEQIASPQTLYQQVKAKLDEIVAVNDISIDPTWASLSKDGLPTGSIILAPLNVHYGRAQGLIMLGHPQPAAFSEQLCELVKNIGAQAATVLKNIFLLEDSQASLHEAQILVTASRMLSTSVELEDAYKAMGQVFLTIGADRCVLGIYVEFDPTNEPSRVQIVDIRGQATQDEDLENIGQIYTLADYNYPYLSSARKTGHILTITDVSGDPNLNDEERALLTHAGIQAQANIPLVSKGVPLGFVLVEYQKPYTFSERELALLRTIANQTTIVIEHSRKIANTQQRARQIETGAEISKIANSILNHEILIQRVVDLIRDGFNFYYVGLFLVDESGQAAELKAGTGEAGAAQLAERHILALDDKSMIGWCMTHREARINLDVGDDAVWFDNPHLPLTRSEMALPLIAHQAVLGAITIQSAQPAAFSRDDITTLQTMADQIANALLNASLLAAAQQRSQELRVLLDINRDISASVQLDKLLDVIVSRAIEIVKADQGTIFLLEEEVLIPKAIAGGLPEIMSLPIPLGDGATGQAALMGRPVLKQAEDPKTVKHIPSASLEPGTLAAIPIRTETKLIGVLLIRRNDITSKFSEDEVKLLEAIALQAAIAVENANLLADTQQAQAQTESLYRISRQIAAANTTEEVAAIAVQHIPKAAFDRLYMILRDDPKLSQNTWGEVMAIWDKKAVSNSFLHARFLVDKLSLIGEEGKIEQIIIEDINDHPLITQEIRPIFKDATKSAAIVTIHADDQILGWLIAETEHADKTFAQSDITPLLAVADQMGVTIDRIQKAEALLAAAQQFAAMVESIPGVVYRAVVDRYYRYQYISDEITDFTGYPVELFLDQTREFFHEIIHPDDYTRVRRTIQNSINRQESYQVQYRIITKAGEIKYISERGRGVFEEQKNLSYVDGILFDVTDREILRRAFQRRATQFEAIVQVGQEASAILDVDRLISATVEQISQTFGFYYAGLFLLDSHNEWAVLKAGSGEAGQKMVAENHRLRRDETSMVGWATSHGKARIALDIGAEPHRFSHPYLPLTRSEIALPLITRAKVIGALDVQSQEQNAFSDDDITTLQLMANQLANVIDNARLFETTQRNLHETDLLYRTTQSLIQARNEAELFTLFIEKTAELGADSISISTFGGEGEGRYLEVKKIWTRYNTPFQAGQRLELKSFFLAPLITQPKMFIIQDIATDERLTDAMRQHFRALDACSIVVIPIMLPGPAGTVHITYKKQPRTFTDSQIRLFESMVQQLTLIWENLRLLTSLERQFRRERIIRQVTGKIHATTGVDEILKTTVSELTKALNAPAGVARLKIHQESEAPPVQATASNKNNT